MILFRATQGRLGNHIFHLASLDKLCEGGERGILFGSDLLDHFIWRRPGVYVLRRSGERLFRKLRVLAKARLTREFREGPVITKLGRLESGDGLLSARNRSFVPLDFVEESFLQSEQWVRDDFTQMLSFRRETMEAVEAFRVSRGLDWENCVFVHVRRGDYLDANFLGAKSVALPTSYFQAGLERMQVALPAAMPVFVTDDAAFVEAAFAMIKRKVVVSLSPVFDLCVMSHCASGVLSASSFSWWGAMFCQRLVRPVAPEHWLGWEKGITFPARIMSAKFDTIPATLKGTVMTTSPGKAA